MCWLCDKTKGLAYLDGCGEWHAARPHYRHHGEQAHSNNIGYGPSDYWTYDSCSWWLALYAGFLVNIWAKLRPVNDSRLKSLCRQCIQGGVCVTCGGNKEVHRWTPDGMRLLTKPCPDCGQPYVL